MNISEEKGRNKIGTALLQAPKCIFIATWQLGLQIWDLNPPKYKFQMALCPPLWLYTHQMWVVRGGGFATSPGSIWDLADKSEKEEVTVLTVLRLTAGQFNFLRDTEDQTAIRTFHFISSLLLPFSKSQWRWKRKGKRHEWEKVWKKRGG